MNKPRTEPKVKIEQVIVVSVMVGDGSSDNPTGYVNYYYKKDGTLIGVES